MHLYLPINHAYSCANSRWWYRKASSFVFHLDGSQESSAKFIILVIFLIDLKSPLLYILIWLHYTMKWSFSKTLAWVSDKLWNVSLNLSKVYYAAGLFYKISDNSFWERFFDNINLQVDEKSYRSCWEKWAGKSTLVCTKNGQDSLC